MAGIYIHIPFCKQKCTYCNFYSIPSLKDKEAYLGSLLKEIELQQDYLYKEKVSTIYFGGGTPSILSSEELQSIFNQLSLFFDIATHAEITIEANPEHLNKEYVSDLKQLGWINRISIGTQSFIDNNLKLLNRRHNSLQCIDSILLLQEFGFKNISIDLIYGIPSLSNEDWIYNLKKASKLNIQHLSCYALTVEENTMLDKMIRKKLIPSVDEKQIIEQFEILLDVSSEHGFIQYEISNFCKPGLESKHNSSYWNGAKYLGLGASAHSFNGISRQWNYSNVNNYISCIKTGKDFFEKEILTLKNCFNEYIMTSLRTNNGVSKNHVKNNFPEHYNYLLESISIYENTGMVTDSNDSFVLTNKGKLFADKIASELFI